MPEPGTAPQYVHFHNGRWLRPDMGMHNHNDICDLTHLYDQGSKVYLGTSHLKEVFGDLVTKMAKCCHDIFLLYILLNFNFNFKFYYRKSFMTPKK